MVYPALVRLSSTWTGTFTTMNPHRYQQGIRKIPHLPCTPRAIRQTTPLCWVADPKKGRTSADQVIGGRTRENGRRCSRYYRLSARPGWGGLRGFDSPPLGFCGL
jgi:hypothetical protein